MTKRITHRNKHLHSFVIKPGDFLCTQFSYVKSTTLCDKTSSQVLNTITVNLPLKTKEKRLDKPTRTLCSLWSCSHYVLFVKVSFTPMHAPHSRFVMTWYGAFNVVNSATTNAYTSCTWAIGPLVYTIQYNTRM